MKTIAIAILAFASGVVVQHYADAKFVADVLRSDDLSITRNVEQANALLDIYEHGKTKDAIERNAQGQETDIAPLTRSERLTAWIDERLVKP